MCDVARAVERDLRGRGVSFKTLAFGAAALGVLMAAPLDAAASTMVTAAAPQIESPARDTLDRIASRRPNDSYDIVATAAPFIHVDGIDDAAVRAAATTVLNTVARDIQHRLVPPPSRLKLEAKSCGGNSRHLAYWNRHRRAIGICSELIQDRLEAETSQRKNAERYFYGRANQASSNRFAAYDAEQSLLFIAYHELGHALVDMYDLEVAGNEEIAVDGFATWWAIQGGVASAAVHGAMTFDQFGIMEDQSPYVVDLDVHGPSTDRYRNIACWLVGAGSPVPDHFVHDLGAGGESFCRTAYRSLAQRWTETFGVYDPEAYRTRAAGP